MAFQLKNKKILVTGASRGIGRGLTLALVKAGAEVYALSKNPDNLKELVTECGGQNSKVHPIQADLADWESTRKAIVDLEPMDGLVNNAGIDHGWRTALETSKAEIDDTFSVNLFGAVNVTQVIGRKMVDAGKGGAIVNVSSINGINPMKDSLAYNMTKAAMDMMTKQFALELGPHQIRVNSVNPTLVMTDMVREHWNDPTKVAKLTDHTPLGRFAEVDEVVGPILYLLSKHSSMVTGTVNHIEGGLLSNISV